MPRSILYFKKIDKFITWSTIVDAPVTWFMNESQYRKYYKEEYGRTGMDGLDKKIEDAKNTGSNWAGYSLEDVITGNRAGEDETDLSEDEIIKEYSL